MTKKKSGLILIGSGILINLVGRVLIAMVGHNNNVLIAGFLALWMFVSLIVTVFGIFRLVVGLISGS